MCSRIMRISLVPLLLIYCCIAAILPFCNIHIEDLPHGYGYIAKQTHQEDDIHVRLHELLFSHFSKKSDHIRNVSSVQLVKQNGAKGKDQFQSDTITDTYDHRERLVCQLLTPSCDAIHLTYCLAFSSSGLSPPSA